MYTSASINQTSTSSSSFNSNTIVQLPKLTISKFFDDPSRYMEFWEQFESAIHSNNSLSYIDKFNYLKSLCGGLALNSISGLSLNSDDNKSAVEIVKNRFGRTDLTTSINSHMNKLLTLNC